MRHARPIRQSDSDFANRSSLDTICAFAGHSERNRLEHTAEVTRALLTTDLVDSTRLNSLLGDRAMALWWAEHDRAARDLIRQWHGQEIGRSDGFLAVFHTVDDAVGCALSYHAHIGRMSPALTARAGVHCGNVSLRINETADVELGATPFEVDGLALPIAVRVMGLASGGQTLLTSTAAAGLGVGGHKLVSHGHWRLKGVSEPLELLEVGPLNSNFSPPAESAKAYRVVFSRGQWLAAQNLPNSLPSERDDFIGRGQTLTQLASHFDNGARLVTLVGPGGIGKTRVALRFARGWLGDFPGGAWFCDLSGATTTDGVLHSVAHGLDLPFSESDPVAQIGNAIAGRGHCLVVLDNVEQVLSVFAPLLAEWLSRASTSRFVVTSRAVIGIATEHVLPVPAMDPAEARDLFDRRARAAGVGSEGPSSNYLAAVHELVDLLDRLPLAIELAAARTRLFNPQSMLEQMHNRFRLLARISGPRDRQSTLRATLDWSWDLLSDAERSTLTQLSVFEGGFDIAAAESVVQVEGQPSIWVGDLLQSLIEQSMLTRLTDVRFGMLRSVQDYARERLPTMDQRAVRAADRHWRHFASLDESALTARRCADIENIVRSCRRATAAGDVRSAAKTLELAGAVLELTGPIRVLLDLGLGVMAMPDLPPAQFAASARILGNAYRAMGQSSLATDAYEQGMVAARAAADEWQLVRLRCAASEPLIRSGGFEQARRLLEEAQESARSLGDPTLDYIVLHSLGNLSMTEGRFGLARDQFEACLSIAQRTGHRRLEGGAQGNLGVAHHYEGSGEAASICYQASLDIASEIGDRHWAANARCNLGLLLSESGRHAEAEPVLRAVCIESRELGQLPLEATALCNLGQLLLSADRHAEAIDPLSAAADIANRLSDVRLAAQSHRLRGQALTATGALLEAADTVAMAEALALRAGDAAELAHALCLQVVLAHRLGRTQEVAGICARATQSLQAVAEPLRRELAAVLLAHAPGIEDSDSPGDNLR